LKRVNAIVLALREGSAARFFVGAVVLTVIPLVFTAAVAVILLIFSSVSRLNFRFPLPPLVFRTACGRSPLLRHYSITFPLVSLFLGEPISLLGCAPSLRLDSSQCLYALGLFIGEPLPLLGCAPYVRFCFLEQSYAFREFLAPFIRSLASLPLHTNCFCKLDDLATTQSERRQQRQGSKAREDSNAPSLFRSFSASDQLRQVVECSNVKLRVHRDTVVFSGLR